MSLWINGFLRDTIRNQTTTTTTNKQRTNTWNEPKSKKNSTRNYVTNFIQYISLVSKYILYLLPSWSSHGFLASNLLWHWKYWWLQEIHTDFLGYTKPKTNNKYDEKLILQCFFPHFSYYLFVKINETFSPLMAAPSVHL